MSSVFLGPMAAVPVSSVGMSVVLRRRMLGFRVMDVEAHSGLHVASVVLGAARRLVIVQVVVGAIG